MTGCRFFRPGAVLLIVAGSVMSPAPLRVLWALDPGERTLAWATTLLSDDALIMGGSGMPSPTEDWVDDVFEKYVVPNVTGDYTPQALITPEEFYPLTGVTSLPFDTSVSQGVTILDGTIRDQLDSDNNVVVFGYSQSATIASLEIEQLVNDPPNLNPDQQLSVVLIGDPSNPDGGILERFDGLTLPSLGLTFGGATPPETPYPTDIYTTEYDGWADFPRYPLDVLSVLNALASSQHFAYSDLTAGEISGAVLLPGSADLTGVGETNYWMIPTDDLPLLDPLRSVPILGNPLADLLQPDLRVLVNLGYGNIEDGWDPGPANVPTEFGLFPTNLNPVDVLKALAVGAQQGINDFITELMDSSGSAMSVPSIADVTNTLVDGLTTGTLPSPADIINAFSAALSTGYGILLPTADIVNTLLITIPAYDVSLFVDGIQALAAGDPMGLLDAIGDPMAADTALLALLASFESTVLTDAVQSIVADLPALTPF